MKYTEKISFFSDSSLGHLDVSDQRDFPKIFPEVFPKIKICNAHKPFHDFMAIPFSTSSLDLKMFDDKEENYKNVNISRTIECFR